MDSWLLDGWCNGDDENLPTDYRENLPRLEKLRKLAGEGQSCLMPLLRGFHQSGFLAERESFVAKYASAFSVACLDGSHPHEWTLYHHEYRDMYERHLQSILESVALSKDDVHSFFVWLHQSAKFLKNDSEDVYTFIDALTSSEDYYLFLNVMFAEVRRQILASLDSTGTRGLHDHEIKVTVPAGVHIGQFVAVSWLGKRFEVAVPVGHTPGETFLAIINVNSDCKNLQACANCGSSADGEPSVMCRFCEEVSYCSAGCQKAAWPRHRLVCGKLL